MKNDLTLDVAVSTDLLAHLWAQSRQMNVPLQWLVAGLICDTFDSTVEEKLVGRLQPVLAVA
jgi:hypothetical protein